MVEIVTKNIDHGALALASGRTVSVIRQPAGRRALFIFEETPEMQKLIDAYENREALPLAAKALINARTDLFHQARRACAEELKRGVVL